MDNTIACPRCGANLVFQSTEDTTASQTVCDFCGAQLSITYENGVPQFTLLPEPEAAAPDLSQPSPETTPDLSQSSPESAPDSGTPPSSNEPAPNPEPSPATQEPFNPQEIPNPVTGEPSSPYVETPIPSFTQQEPQQTPFSSFTPQEPPQKKKMNPWLIAAIVIVVVLCLCCVCGGVGAFWYINSGQNSSTLVPLAGLIF